jgi:hypothetical protein
MLGFQFPIQDATGWRAILSIAGRVGGARRAPLLRPVSALDSGATAK